MTRNDLTTATRAALTSYLKGADAYNGIKLDGTAVCRAGLDALRAHAVATYDAANPAPADKADKADKADDAPRCAMTGRKLSAKQQDNDDAVQQLVAAGTMTAAAWLALTGNVHALQAPGWTAGDGDKRQPATFNPHYMAALRVGADVTWAGDRNGTGTLAAVQLDDAAADAQRADYSDKLAAYKVARAARKATRPDVSVSVVAARVQPVNAKTLAKLVALVGRAGVAQEDGSVVLTADDLALAGIAASWATTPQVHLDDAAHVKARTLAALDYTGTAARGVLVLTPIVADTAAAAVA